MIDFKIKKYAILFVLFIGNLTYTQEDWHKSAYFDTQFLLKYDEVKESLFNDGFYEITFRSLDRYPLKGLYRKKDNAHINVVISAGFYPGRKEGMASFVKLLPDDCNILFLDARGHGESSGPFWSTIVWYGQNEYKDIVGALDFLCAENNLPNLLLGVCIGAFHCAHTALYLEQKNLIQTYQLKGLIFDSGFGSIADLIWIPTEHIKEKILPHLLVSWIYTEDNKKTVKNRWAYQIASTVSSFCTQIITYAASPFFYAYDGRTNLFDKIHQITVPIFYIHSKNDKYTPFIDAKQLANCTQNKICWWIDRSEHACNHLKFKEEYKGQLLEFINNSVHT